MAANVTIDTHKHPPVTLLMCSSEVGWRSLLLRKYTDEPTVKEFEQRPVSDQQIG
jgi:hypothetical protein